jgi:molybdopterin molybdotransferase
VLKAGHRLRAQDIGLIASLGFDTVKAWRRLKVAIVSTGSELVEPGQAIEPGQIYNSNHYMMDALLSGWGFEVIDLGVTEDDPEVLSEVMTRASKVADVIITSGGVSVGEEDHVKDVVESLGSIDLWRIAIKPGKPFAYGQVHGTPFLGLPGNPVSALVTLLVISRPFLFASQGMRSTDIVPLRQPALFDKPGSTRQEYLRIRSRAEGVELFSQQSSGVLYSTTWGDGMVVQYAGQDIARGDAVDVIPYLLFN